MKTFSDILDDILYELSMNRTQLAAYLGIRRSTLTLDGQFEVLSNKRLVKYKKLTKEKNINPDFLKFGILPIFLSKDNEFQKAIPLEQEITNTYHKPITSVINAPSQDAPKGTDYRLLYEDQRSKIDALKDDKIKLLERLYELTMKLRELEERKF